MEIVQEPQFIKDNVGKDIYAILPIDRYNELIECEQIVEEWEDKEDLKAYQERKDEPTIPLEELLKEYRVREYNGGK